MRLATVIPLSSKVRAVKRAASAQERSTGERASVVDIIRREQILEIFVEAAALGRCGSPSLKRRWNADDREHERARDAHVRQPR